MMCFECVEEYLRGSKDSICDPPLAEQSRARSAVRCAIEVQNGMVKRNGGRPPERTNRIEGFRSLVRRGVVDTLYVVEFHFRANNRKNMILVRL
jgi:hypothetical protein